MCSELMGLFTAEKGMGEWKYITGVKMLESAFANADEERGSFSQALH